MPETAVAQPASAPRGAGAASMARLPVKVLLIVIAALVLLAPLEFIGELTREREARRDEAVAGIQRAGPARSA